ncbi:phosphoribosylamine--glycine ligase [Roseomonas nepalensis]|uniref:Phosphoribosylamine--glycine ligase n=1 Tax=Muricoccus nepalensis TaxID=1854500 RepID=A0A502GBH1_9PROT|nr:phosphoribosylamine--glycine ligase [Roseomonas nepalensis]TPG58053.1 phosphoribosylamine--glycine ligase [Roseomonas nepalensis]
MTRPTLLLMGLLLAACAANDPLPRATNPTEAACRREAEESPAVRAGFARLPPTANADLFNRAKADLAATERTAYFRCLRDKGLAPPGGVEAVRPPR